MLTRWTDLDRALYVMGRMSRLFDEYDAARWPTLPRLSAGAWPPVNVHDAGDELVVRAQVPGMSHKDIRITGQQDSLALHGERRIDPPEGYSAHREERAGVSFSRSFTLPCKVDFEKTSATVKDGILTVRLAKATEAKPRQIEVKARS